MYYVYTYTDPTTNKVFYVGKGTKYRYKAHLKPSLWENSHKTVNPWFYGKIKSLMKANTPPIVSKVLEDVEEHVALKYEFEMIAKYGTFNNGGQLYNIATSSGPVQGTNTHIWTDKRREEHQNRCRLNRKFDPTYDEMYDMFITKNMRRKDISELFDVSDALVKNRLRELGISKSKELECLNKERLLSVTCECCGKTINVIPSRAKVLKYCSDKCRLEKWHDKKL